MKFLSAPKKYPFMLTFPKSKRADFQSISRLFQKADLFKESESEVLLAFGKSKGQVALFQSIFNVASKWSGLLVFTRGGYEPFPWKVFQILSCYTGSFDAVTPKAYCQGTFDRNEGSRRGSTITISFKMPKPNIFPDEPNIARKSKPQSVPCRKVASHLKDGSREEMLYWANELRCVACPNFKMPSQSPVS